MDTNNIFDNIPVDQVDEVFDTLIEKGGMKVERIVSTGQISPVGFWYDQSKGEWVIVLEGRAVIEFEDGKKADMRKGDHIYIAPHQKHRVAYTDTKGPTLWIAVHFDI